MSFNQEVDLGGGRTVKRTSVGGIVLRNLENERGFVLSKSELSVFMSEFLSFWEEMTVNKGERCKRVGTLMISTSAFEVDGCMYLCFLRYKSGQSFNQSEAAGRRMNLTVDQTGELGNFLSVLPAKMDAEPAPISSPRTPPLDDVPVHASTSSVEPSNVPFSTFTSAHQAVPVSDHSYSAGVSQSASASDVVGTGFIGCNSQIEGFANLLDVYNCIKSDSYKIFCEQHDLDRHVFYFTSDALVKDILELSRDQLHFTMDTHTVSFYSVYDLVYSLSSIVFENARCKSVCKDKSDHLVIKERVKKITDSELFDDNPIAAAEFIYVQSCIDLSLSGYHPGRILAITVLYLEKSGLITTCVEKYKDIESLRKAIVKYALMHAQITLNHFRNDNIEMLSSFVLQEATSVDAIFLSQ